MFGGLAPWKAVRDVLDFSDEGIDIFNRPKPLVEKSLERIYAGLLKHVATGNGAFLVKYLGNNEQNGINNGVSVDVPAPVVTTQNRLYLASAHFLSKYYSGDPDSKNIGVDQPAGTMTTTDSHALVSTNFIVQQQNDRAGQSISVDRPARTLTTTGGNQELVSANFLTSYYGNGGTTTTDEPIGTLTTRDRVGLIRCHSFIYSMHRNNTGTSLERPAPTILTNNHHYLIRADAGQVAIAIFETDSPATVKIKQFMAAHGIVSITMRMLRVSELKRIQGFPAHYYLAGNQTDAKKFIGNSVVPDVVSRWVEAMHTALTM